MKRAASSDRIDDNIDTLKKRFKSYNDQTKPVLELYSRFGKVRRIDASKEINEVYAETKASLIPETFFMIGTKGSGKTQVGKALAERTNMGYLSFKEFQVSQKKAGKKGDDESLTQSLIVHLLDSVEPRILIEGFPQNLNQAKYFLKNCGTPSRVFHMKCSKDISQERMIELGKNHHEYIPSAILSKLIKEFHEQAPTLIPYLKKNSKFEEIDAEMKFDLVYNKVCALIEPTIIHIRSGTNNDLRKEMIAKLVEEHGYVNLEANSLIRDETERRTDVGQEFLAMVSAGKIIPADMIVRMLRKIIYSG
jgi:adenylate kinase family enzyme